MAALVLLIVRAVSHGAGRVPYLHFVWHLFALAGAVSITFSALLFVV